MEIIKEEEFFRECARCGKDISNKNIQAKFCSRSCKSIFNTKVKRFLKKQLKNQKGTSGI